MLEGIQSFLVEVGQLVDPDPQARGALALGGLVLSIAGYLAGRLRSSSRARVRVDCPPGQSVDLRISPETSKRESD